MAKKLYSKGIEFSPATNVKTVGGDLGNMTLEQNFWYGKNAVFFGDSITFGTGTTKKYQEYLKEWLNIGNTTYAFAGHKWSDLYTKAQVAIADGNSYDAIFIFYGTNDFNDNIPIGEWYSVTEEAVNKNGQTVTLKKRTMTDTTTTMKGNINRAMALLKANYPKAKIIVMTPLHRGYANFASNNIQPDERYANTLGLWIDDYVDAIKEIGKVWSVEVIDLFSNTGIYPMVTENDALYFNGGNDNLHPNAKGHEVIARCIANKLVGISAPMVVE